MASYRGHPVDLSERPAQHSGTVGPSSYRVDDTRYTLTNDSITLYTLQTPAPSPPHNAAPRQFGVPSGSSASGSSSSSTERSGPPLVYFTTRCSGEVHPQAVCVGPDRDGGRLYLGRAYILGELLPGKVTPTHRVCYVALGGREYALSRYEVLVLERGVVEWVTAQDGGVPPGALPTGLTANGRDVYTARATCSGIVTPGYLKDGDTVARISYDMKELTFSSYEVLTLRAQAREETSSDGGHGSTVADSDSDSDSDAVSGSHRDSADKL